MGALLFSALQQALIGQHERLSPALLAVFLPGGGCARRGRGGAESSAAREMAPSVYLTIAKMWWCRGAERNDSHRHKVLGWILSPSATSCMLRPVFFIQFLNSVFMAKAKSFRNATKQLCLSISTNNVA